METPSSYFTIRSNNKLSISKGLFSMILVLFYISSYINIKEYAYHAHMASFQTHLR